ncbi:hypothetical protein QN379_17875 [Glaciimonas sp. Gout2]|uniref:hypothetical protein n=1 Tax=unclassified Glaciimonas TaxID=2644401 RepID=UPI002B230889|nr:MULTISPECIES: hypothetical protein [unclassified Glaciimonas]MEB0012124.1 hypothetical protein [Glaciimonas sp. Cout2]MEB0083880.1 hypothetical protein [Glaciimonas sp. Gout2]
MKKIISLFVKNGNLRGRYQFIFGIIGISLLLLPAFILMSYALEIICVSIGTIIGGLGGYAAKADILKIKPFDNSYKKAKDSYEKEDKK